MYSLSTPKNWMKTPFGLQNKIAFFEVLGPVSYSLKYAFRLWIIALKLFIFFTIKEKRNLSWVHEKVSIHRAFSNLKIQIVFRINSIKML